MVNYDVFSRVLFIGNNRSKQISETVILCVRTASHLTPAEAPKVPSDADLSAWDEFKVRVVFGK